VTPLEALPSQFPFARFTEPRAMDGQLERNPRDSLVTLIAYTRGEEHFSDDNSNGVRDPGEQFIDQGEPFVDSNDNGVRDDGETYIDEAPADGKWNGPNGVWDKDTSIWTAEHILYTARPIGENSLLMADAFATWPPTHTPFSGTCEEGGGVPKATSVFIQAYFADVFFNRPQAASTTLTASKTTSRGSATFLSNSLLDGYGFGIERRKVSAADESDCRSSTPVCRWKTLFYKWHYGYVGDIEIKGATDTQLCSADTLKASAAVLNQTLLITTPGAMK